jgi:hypothetical protein
MIKTYSVIHYEDARFSHLYKYNRDKKEFKTADLPSYLPDDGFIMLDCMGRVVGMSVSVMCKKCGESEIHEAYWAYKKNYAKYGVKLTDEMICKKNNACYLGRIFKDGLKEHRAAFIASMRIGFNVVAENDDCYIVKREV